MPGYMNDLLHPPSSRRQSSRHEGGRSVKRILFVHDESNILDGIRRLLHADRKRWDMQFAIGGEAALRAFEAGRFHEVIRISHTLLFLVKFEHQRDVTVKRLERV